MPEPTVTNVPTPRTEPSDEADVAAYTLMIDRALLCQWDQAILPRPEYVARAVLASPEHAAIVEVSEALAEVEALCNAACLEADAVLSAKGWRPAATVRVSTLRTTLAAARARTATPEAGS